MIEITGARGGDKPAEDGSERSRFGMSEERRTPLPLLIGLVITAVAGYVRAAFPDLRWPSAPGQASEGTPREADPPVSPRVQHLDASDEIAAADDLVARFAPRLVADGDLYGRFAGNVIAFPGRPFRLVDSVPFDFAPIELPSIDLAGPTPVPPAPPLVIGGSGGSQGGAQGPVETERRNRAPEGGATVRLNEAVAGGVLLIGFDQLLANIRDPEGSALSIGDIAVSEGSVARTSEGFIYSSNAAETAKTVLVTFEVTDGENVVTRYALIPLVRGPISGTEADDILVGTSAADQIEAGAGHDIIDGRGGADAIWGGEGDDRIVGGSGDDTIFAGAGSDIVLAGPGNDVVSGGNGDDRIDGEVGDDSLHGDGGNDLLFGGAGNDLAVGGLGDDYLDGGEGADILDGGDGADTFHDGDGEDRVLGGDGDDVVMAAADTDDDYFAGGDGDDTLDYSGHVDALVIDTVAGTATASTGATDRISGFEILVGGDGDDIFMIGGQEARLTGGDGQDSFIFDLPDDVHHPTLIHDILDFVMGDRIRVAAFEFTMEEREEEDRFGRYYRDRDDDEPAALELRIRHRHDDDEGQFTIFEFDGDGDFEFEMTVAVHGHHQPYVYETSNA